MLTDKHHILTDSGLLPRYVEITKTGVIQLKVTLS